MSTSNANVLALGSAYSDLLREENEIFSAWRPMRRIVGGAYNTYFPAEATCQFNSSLMRVTARTSASARRTSGSSSTSAAEAQVRTRS